MRRGGSGFGVRDAFRHGFEALSATGRFPCHSTMPHAAAFRLLPREGRALIAAVRYAYLERRRPGGRRPPSGSNRRDESFLPPLHPMATISEAYDRAVEIHRQGRLEQAAEIYRRILAVEPEHAGAWHLLGVIAQQRGDPITAIEYIRRSIRQDATRPAPYANLGAALRFAGQLPEAEEALRHALRMAPDFTQALTNLGLTLADQDRAEEALEHFHHVQRIDPRDSLLARGLAHCLAETGRVEEALAVYQRGLEIEPQPILRLLQATLLPLVYRSRDDLQHWRGRMIDAVDRLIAEGLQIDLEQEQAVPVFSLAHQGCNDRELQARLVKLYRPPPPLSLPPSPRRAGRDRRIRVGFLSSYFNTHTVGKLSRGLIADLNRDDFRVVVLSLGEHHDPVADFIRAAADEFVLLPRQVEAMRAAVAAARLDVLIYTELGMSTAIYTLAFSRLAPVQCVTWGHPSTTGLPTMDYFLSSDAMEPPAAAEHYTERLVRLPSLTFCFHRPPAPARTRDRAGFGLDPRVHSYVCPQSIYKFHPDFDPILGRDSPPRSAGGGGADPVGLSAGRRAAPPALQPDHARRGPPRALHRPAAAVGVRRAAGPLRRVAATPCTSAAA